MFIGILEKSTSSGWYIRAYEMKDSYQERERKPINTVDIRS